MMTDYELDSYIRKRHYYLSEQEYIYICYNCPQINYNQYDAYSNKFIIRSDAGNRWAFDVYKERVYENKTNKL